MIVQFFVPSFTGVYDKLLNWVMIISIPAFVIGLTSLIKLHSNRIIRKTPNMPYSIVAFIAMITMALMGLIGGTGEKTGFEWMFKHIQVPMQATMFSLLAFYIASAAYRAFRARTLEATLMLVTAVIVMLARVPIGNFLWHLIMPDSNLPEQVSSWILNVPSMAARRGIILGISLGAIATSIKIILGIERSYMGAGE